MNNSIDVTDVPTIEAADLHKVLEILIENGQGLALLRGLNETEIREIEDVIWSNFTCSAEARVALALRLRALLEVFASRRLKALFLERGFRLFSAAMREAASHRLNIHFGFNPQRLLLALDALTAHPIAETQPAMDLQIAA